MLCAGVPGGSATGPRGHFTCDTMPIGHTFDSGVAGIQVPPPDPGNKRPAPAAPEAMLPAALGAAGLPRAPAGAGASPLKRRRLESQLSPAGRV